MHQISVAACPSPRDATKTTCLKRKDNPVSSFCPWRKTTSNPRYTTLIVHWFPFIQHCRIMFYYGFSGRTILMLTNPAPQKYVNIYRVSQETRSIFWEVTASVILSKKKVYIYMCPFPNGFRDRDISLYSSKIVDQKETLRIVSNTGIYCSSDKVGTVYLV
jgi:hypothetical protein